MADGSARNRILGSRLSRTEAAVLLGPISQARKAALRADAAAARRKHHGDAVRLCAVVLLSNHCERHCTHCPWRVYNKSVVRWHLADEAVVEAIELARSLGAVEVALAGGDGGWIEPERIAGFVRRAAGLGLDVSVALGFRSPAEQELWRKAGADGFWIPPVTGARALFERLYPDRSFDEVPQQIARLRGLGYRISSGPIVGLPRQTADDLAMDLAFFAEAEVDMVRISRFVPARGTPLSASAPADAESILKAIAVARLMMPRAHVPATTTWDAWSDVDRIEALSWGADTALIPVARDGRVLHELAGSSDKLWWTCAADQVASPDAVSPAGAGE